MEVGWREKGEQTKGVSERESEGRREEGRE